MNNFLNYVKSRRSIYGISAESTISSEKIIELVEFAVKETPSPYNSQSSRVVVLFGDEHKQLWNIAECTLQKIVSPAKFATTKEKLDSFAAGYGSILFFEDSATVTALQSQLPAFAEQFPLWSLQSSGMLQHVVWVALESEGLGASLQHYNPLIDSAVKANWGLPTSWRLMSQMPFGKPTSSPKEKDYLPIHKRVRIFGK